MLTIERSSIQQLAPLTKSTSDNSLKKTCHTQTTMFHLTYLLLTNLKSAS